MTGWKYIVSWVLVVVAYGSPPPEVDEYGRVSPWVYAYCIEHKRYEHHERIFTSRDSAVAFYNKAVNDVDSVRLDSSYTSRP